MQSVAYPLVVKPLKIQSSTVTLTFDLWPWKSIGCQIFVSITWVPSLVEIHWTMLSIQKKCYGRTDRCMDGWTVALLYPLHNFVGEGITMFKAWSSQGCYGIKIWPCDLDFWPWKSLGFQIFLRTKNVPSLVKIHWKMLILECSQGCYRVKIRPCDLDLWPMTLKINRVPDIPKD
jgi:hypothetical protein